jgi:ribonuclease VapC
VTAVLDASAMLAYLLDEDGSGMVEDVLVGGALISAANLAEVLSKLADNGVDPERLVAELATEGIIGGLLDVQPLEAADAPVIGRLRPLTREYGLGLADRACLALGMRTGLPILTADAAWSDLRLDRITVHQIR